MNTNVQLRSLTESDYQDWQKLFNGYLNFQKQPFQQVRVDLLWQWLMNGDILSVVAVVDGQLVGIAHFREMLSPLYACKAGFLDDLFVEADFRGQHIADLIIDEMANMGKQKGWRFIRWLTHHHNYRGRQFYDKLTNKTWLSYQLDLI